jgi:hypothetical protein
MVQDFSLLQRLLVSVVELDEASCGLVGYFKYGSRGERKAKVKAGENTDPGPEIVRARFVIIE